MRNSADGIGILDRVDPDPGENGQGFQGENWSLMTRRKASFLFLHYRERRRWKIVGSCALLNVLDADGVAWEELKPERRGTPAGRRRRSW